MGGSLVPCEAAVGVAESLMLGFAVPDRHWPCAMAGKDLCEREADQCCHPCLVLSSRRYDMAFPLSTSALRPWPVAP